jgi:signal peptidase II
MSRQDNASQGSQLPRWIALALLVILLDQLVKHLIVSAFDLGDSYYVTSFFSIVRAHNTGAAFSFLAGAGGWQRWFFVGLAIAAVVFIGVMLKRYGHQRVFALALSLILGGAVGNVIDRLWHGYVVDFLLFHWKDTYYFPAFNIADCGITIGAALLIIDELRRVKRG